MRRLGRRWRGGSNKFCASRTGGEFGRVPSARGVSFVLWGARRWAMICAAIELGGAVGARVLHRVGRAPPLTFLRDACRIGAGELCVGFGTALALVRATLGFVGAEMWARETVI